MRVIAATFDGITVVAAQQNTQVNKLVHIKAGLL